MKTNSKNKNKDQNSNKWAALFIVSEILIVGVFVAFYFITKQLWILGAAGAYFVFTFATFMRMLTERKAKKNLEKKEQVDGKEK